MLDYLSTPEDVKRFVFYALIGFCVLQSALEVYKGVRKRG
ncbi:hypothetical protein SAMN05216345_111116 [Cupriavidus sp. YR651]|nr:hypothetical protein SAMN05216345_111116 [Cupriavidus sp. YR651]